MKSGPIVTRYLVAGLFYFLFVFGISFGQVEESPSGYVRCSTPTPSEAELLNVRNSLNSWLKDNANALNAAGDMTVPIAFHVVRHNDGVTGDVNDQMNEGIVLYNLGVIAVWQGRYADATAQVSASYAISQQISDREGDAYALTQLGKIHRLQGEYDEAQRCYRLALSLRQEMNQTHFFAENQIGLALLEIATGQDPQQNIDAVLAVVRADPIISGVDSPFEIYQDLVEALIQQNHPDVSAILLQAHNLLQKQAAQFEDDAMRQSFLENIPAHRQLVAWFSGYPFLNETINGRYQLRKKLG